MRRHSELSPVQLVQECAGSNDAGAWAEFIRRFRPVIVSAVLRTARKFDTAPSRLLDDLLQETYLKLCEDNSRLLRSFRPEGEDSIYGFLKVVAANITHDHFKSELAGKRGAGQTDALSEVAHVDPRTRGSDCDDAVHRNLQVEEIEKILSQVTAGKDQRRKRLIFWLRHRQGLTASEIAALPMIGLSTEGVESVLLRLSAMIRSHIGKNGKLMNKSVNRR